MIELIEDISIKEIHENENPKKVFNIVEKSLNFKEQQTGRGLKMLSPKQMLARLPIALAQVKASITSEFLSNKIHEIIYSLY